MGNDKPHVIYTTSSSYSGKINVWDHGGSLVLEVGGYPQSVSINTPDLKERYWFRAVEEVSLRLKNPLRALLLGVGGATILHLLRQKFPDLELVGVELDGEIVRVAKRFFDLDRIGKLEVLIQDGGEYVQNYQGNPFDLIFVDTYLGGNFPLHFEERGFLLRLRDITSPNGVVVINCAGGFNLRSFEALLSEVFAQVEVVKVPIPGFLGGLGNFLYFCSR